MAPDAACKKKTRSLLTACSPLAQESRASSSSCSHGSFRRWRGRQLGSFQKKKKEGSSDRAGPKYIRRSSTARVDGPAGPKGPGFFGSGPAQQPAETGIRCGGPGVTWLGGSSSPPTPRRLALPPIKLCLRSPELKTGNKSRNSQRSPPSLSRARAPRRRSPQSKSPNPSARADTGHIGGESAPVRRLLPVFPDPIPPPPPAAAPNRIADSRLLIFFCARSSIRGSSRSDRRGFGST